MFWYTKQVQGIALKLLINLKEKKQTKIGMQLQGSLLWFSRNKSPSSQVDH
jgi:hypothetical protein